VICLLFVALITAAQAQTWTYTFSGTNFTPGGDGLSVAFQYSTQAPITADILLMSSQLISCTKLPGFTNYPGSGISAEYGVWQLGPV